MRIREPSDTLGSLVPATITLQTTVVLCAGYVRICEPSDTLGSLVPATVPQPSCTNQSLSSSQPSPPQQHRSYTLTLIQQLPLVTSFSYLTSTRTISIRASVKLVPYHSSSFEHSHTDLGTGVDRLCNTICQLVQEA